MKNLVNEMQNVTKINVIENAKSLRLALRKLKVNEKLTFIYEEISYEVVKKSSSDYKTPPKFLFNGVEMFANEIAKYIYNDEGTCKWNVNEKQKNDEDNVFDTLTKHQEMVYNYIRRCKKIVNELQKNIEKIDNDMLVLTNYDCEIPKKMLTKREIYVKRLLRFNGGFANKVLNFVI